MLAWLLIKSTLPAVAASLWKTEARRLVTLAGKRYHPPCFCVVLYGHECDVYGHVQAVRKDLADWFGAGEVSNFKFLKMYRIPFSLPSSGAPGNLKQSHELGGNVFICGDHRMSCSLHDAIVSGRKAADAVTAATPASAAVPA